MDKKRVLLIGGGVIVAGVGVYLFRKYEANSAAQTAAANDAANQTDAQLAQMLLENPLSNSGGGNSSASVSGPTVNTGSESLQTLINSVLNPSVPASTTGPGVSTGTVAPTVPVSGTGPGVSTGTLSDAPSLPSGGNSGQPGVATGTLTDNPRPVIAGLPQHVVGVSQLLTMPASNLVN